METGSANPLGTGSTSPLETGSANPLGTGPTGPAGSVETGSGETGFVGSLKIGSAGAELSFVPQARKVKPLPLWVHPLPEAATTSCFGPRWGRLHAGVDLAAPDGTRIRAAGEGTVVAAGPAEGYGNAVLIDHGNGYLTHYGHMSVITVTPGQHVAVGEQLGNEGSTGHSTGPHLHFEVHQGSYQNPIEPTAWMHEHGVDITGCAATAAQ
ncbi:M23 family peptidase [Actinoplanes sp. ATCC 53533]|nr:M23 family peptidase [Actinoplanes sp. ATCC 53533]